MTMDKALDSYDKDKVLCHDLDEGEITYWQISGQPKKYPWKRIM